MSFIGNYFKELHNSDEATKHRAALTMAVVASVIVLSIVFLLIKDSLLSLPNQNKKNIKSGENRVSEKDIESPVSAFASFFEEAGKQLSKAKGIFNDVSNLKDNLETASGTLNTNNN